MLSIFTPMKPITGLALVLSFAVSACGSYRVSTESLATQLRENQQVSHISNFASLGRDYPSNGLTRIECTDKSGRQVWLYPDKNVEFKIATTDGKKLSVYFDTLILQGDTLYGLRSRILGGLRVVPLSSVQQVTIRAEAPRTEPVR